MVEGEESSPLAVTQREASSSLVDHPKNSSGRGVIWLTRLFGVQEIASSNLAAPTIRDMGR